MERSFCVRPLHPTNLLYLIVVLFRAVKVGAEQFMGFVYCDASTSRLDHDVLGDRGLDRDCESAHGLRIQTSETLPLLNKTTALRARLGRPIFLPFFVYPLRGPAMYVGCVMCHLLLCQRGC